MANLWMFQRAIAADPSFRKVFDAVCGDWSEEGGVPLYVVCGEFTRHLVEHLAANRSTALRKLFAVIEEWHLDPDPAVREAAIIGVIEGIQNPAVHASTKPEQFLEYLGPESLRFWNKIEAFWSSGHPIADE